VELNTEAPATPVFLPRQRKFVVGVDPGKSADPTAICVLEHIKGVLDYRSEFDRHCDIIGPPQKPAERFLVRHLQRLKLGTSYVDVAAHIRDLMSRPPLCGDDLGVKPAELVVDQTGVGAAVVDLFEAIGLRPIKIVITAGNRVEAKGFLRNGQASLFHVPKTILISDLDAALHTGDLKIAPALLEAGALQEELKDFQRSLSAVGRSTYSAREGKSDDLVLAVSYAVWWAKRPPPPVTSFSTYSASAPPTEFSGVQNSGR
jgi:hypothetical protein